VSWDPERHPAQEQYADVVESLVETFIRLPQITEEVPVLHVTADIQRRNQKIFSSI
jgi:hypothetical protein